MTRWENCVSFMIVSKGPDNNVENIIMLHSWRPHSIEGHMAIYKYMLHHSSNTTPKWFLETWCTSKYHK